MNERIKELAEQADIKFDVYSDNYGVDTATVVPYDLEKFAELIVRECIMVCWPGGESDILYEQASAIDKAFIDGQDVCVERLKQHFGVKE
jgi:hypothetical protein